MWGAFGVHKPGFLAAHVSCQSVLLHPTYFRLHNISRNTFPSRNAQLSHLHRYSQTHKDVTPSRNAHSPLETSCIRHNDDINVRWVKVTELVT
jgi:hypothetical protein